MVYLCIENVYILSLSVLKFYYISIYEKNNTLLLLCYITAFIQLFIFMYTIIMFAYNYFNDRDLNKNTTHIILLFFIISFINYIIYSNLYITEINDIYYDVLYLLIRIDIYSSFIFIMIRYIIIIMDECDII